MSDQNLKVILGVIVNDLESTSAILNYVLAEIATISQKPLIDRQELIRQHGKLNHQFYEDIRAKIEALP